MQSWPSALWNIITQVWMPVPSAHAAETLAELSRRGWRQSVLSASRRDYLIEQVAARGLQGYFTELLGLADIYGVSKVQVGKQWLAQSGIALLPA